MFVGQELFAFAGHIDSFDTRGTLVWPRPRPMVPYG